MVYNNCVHVAHNIYESKGNIIMSKEPVKSDFMFDNTIGMKWGLESEGFITINQGQNCFPASQWLPGTRSALGQDGRSDTVEYRSVPFVHIDTLTQDVIERVKAVSLPKESSLVFHPYAENRNENGSSGMPCGLHISFSLNNSLVKNSCMQYIRDNTYQNHIQRILPMSDINKLEGPSGKKRRSSSGYGRYSGGFRRRSREYDGYEGVEYRVLSSSMSDYPTFSAVVGIYQWLSWSYMFNKLAMNLKHSDIAIKTKCNPALIPAIKTYYKAKGDSRILTPETRSYIAQSSTLLVREEFFYITGINIVRALDHVLSVMSRETGYQISDIYEVLSIPKKATTAKYCTKCCRKSSYCYCKHPCATCQSTTYSGRLCAVCSSCCSCNCIPCRSCSTNYATRTEYNAHLCDVCNTCPSRCGHFVCGRCNHTFIREFSCRNCRRYCENCCNCIENINGIYTVGQDTDGNIILIEETANA